ncbi:hypothetical protein KCP76_07370 [Salmonella enterica subsp. enterica serovar Weltevreden]|nr:hypothetical protein KCP76_07370 [Salmonella enterica subsp. enterica serovar Weltevreden]
MYLSDPLLSPESQRRTQTTRCGWCASGCDLHDLARGIMRFMLGPSSGCVLFRNFQIVNVSAIVVFQRCNGRFQNFLTSQPLSCWCRSEIIRQSLIISTANQVSNKEPSEQNSTWRCLAIASIFLLPISFFAFYQQRGP